MQIKGWDFSEEYKRHKNELLAAVDAVLSSGNLILGVNVKEFEKQFAQYCGAKYAVGVDNGTNALFLSLKALGIGQGDEVITVANTAVPTVSAIVSAGAKPVFVDVQEHSFLIDPHQIENAIHSNTRCILPVHLYGRCAEMDTINQIAHKHGLFVLEDCAQSHGATYKGQKAGSFADVAATSFYPTKILGCCGDGGMILTNSEELYKKLCRIRMYGMEKNYYSVEHGYNSRLDELQAAILLMKLKNIEENIQKRRKIADLYREYLKSTSLILPEENPDGLHTYYLFVVRHPERNIILDELRKKEIFLNIHYPYPIHTMQGYRDLGYKKGDLPVTERLADEVFSLPVYPYFTEEQQEYLCQQICEVLQKHRL